ncbi:MAG: T9SS type A sorting domain-containing protein [Flavobacteriales bacterium]|nr:T9SS type A sorting domain-containing protein [Flavobacteriales bacterium]
MKHFSSLTICAALLLAGAASAQYEVLSSPFWASGVNNDGLVAGYMAGGPTYQLWNPDLGTTEDIGGMSPDGGGAGQPKFSTDGQLVCGTDAGGQGSEMATYDRTAGTWAVHGGIGGEMDGNVSSAWDISGDGATVVGLGWLASFSAHGIAWNSTEGMLDLGSVYPGASTRANAVNGDGSVVVGWQDFNGPWKSAVWRKNPLGGYFPNEFILIDPEGDPNSDFNQAGECSAVSEDGTWIGGYGDYANNNEPWIWSEATGMLSLGALPNMGRGFVSGMSADGSIVVGWFDGQFFGSPRKAFIWTEADGLQDLNTYATTVLGVVLNGQQLYSASDISPDGHYITGTGMGSSFDMFAFRLELGTTTGLFPDHAKGAINAWPNPVIDVLNLENDGAAELTLAGVDGAVVLHQAVPGSVQLDLSGLAAGVYTLELRGQGVVRTRRIVKH